MKTHSLLLFKTIIIASVLVASSYTFANDKAELKQAADAACDKIKMCIKKQATDEGMSPEMVKMIDNIAENSCKSLYQINELTAYDNLLDPITSCYKAMAKSSCADLEEGKQPKACIDLEKQFERL